MLEQAYGKVCSVRSDINEHLPTLRRLAEQCTHVTEFGVRGGNSTTALLAGSINGKLKKLVSYDINPCTDTVRRLSRLAPVGLFQFANLSSLAATIETTDLLFIDTLHTGWHLHKEIVRHHQSVRKFIVLHDTEVYGLRGEKGRLGLIYAIHLFLHRTTGWVVTEHYTNSCGLTVISREQG